jgi:[ribosomal protein S5]-alanine N-acetyltransferase
MILSTPRLRLRPMTGDDAAFLFGILGDPAAMAFWDRPALTRLAVAEEMIGEQLAATREGFCLYWTVLNGSEPIGSCDLSLIDRKSGSAETGFLFAPSFWGQGYAGEALAAVMAHGRGKLGLTRLTGRIHARNLRAENLLTRQGFVLELSLPRHLLPSGARADCALYAKDLTNTV